MSTPLEKTIARAQACLDAGGTFVTSVSLDPVVAIAALKVAELERRDFSNLIDVALAEYSKVNSPTPLKEELLAKITAALGPLDPAAQTKLLGELDKAVLKVTRTRRAKAA